MGNNRATLLGTKKALRSYYQTRSTNALQTHGLLDKEESPSPSPSSGSSRRGASVEIGRRSEQSRRSHSRPSTASSIETTGETTVLSESSQTINVPLYPEEYSSLAVMFNDSSSTSGASGSARPTEKRFLGIIPLKSSKAESSDTEKRNSPPPVSRSSTDRAHQPTDEFSALVLFLLY